MDRPRNRRTTHQDPAATKVGKVVTDAYSKRAPTPSQPSSQRRRFPRRTVWGWGVRILTVLMILLLGRQLLLPIQHIQIGGGVESDVASALERYFATYSRRNASIRSESLETGLLLNLERATDVEVRHDLLLSRIEVHVTSDEPAIRWQSRGVQYTLSTSGVALHQTDIEGEGALPLIFDKSDVPIELKTQVVPSVFIAFVQDMEVASKDLKLKIVEREVENSTRELLVRFKARPYNIRLSTAARAGEALRALLKLEAHLAKQQVRPSNTQKWKRDTCQWHKC